MTRRIRLLYVDPDSSRSESVLAGLEETVETIRGRGVGSAEEARNAVRERPFDCVVSRFRLPTGDGRSLLADLSEERSELTSILFTSAASESLIEEVYAAGIDEYVHDAGTGGIRVLAHHVTERCRDRREDSLERSETHLESLTEAAADAILTIDTDEVVRFANPAIESVLGYSPDEVVGSPLTDLMPEDLVEPHRRGFRRYLETDTRRLDWQQIELRGRHRDGHDVPLSVSFSEFWFDGERYFTGILRDISGRKERERELTLYEAMLQAAQDGIYALNDDGRFVGVNRAYADLVGRSREELIGRPVSEVVPETTAEAATDIQKRLESGEEDSLTLETTLETSDGGELPVEVRISLFPLDGETHGRVGVVRDVSRRHRRERQLRELNETAQRLTAAETIQEVADLAVEVASDALNLPFTAIELYDPETGGLEPVSRTPEASSLADDGSLLGSSADLPWDVFSEGRPRVVDDLGTGSEDEPTLRSAVILPVGEYGVFVSGGESPNSFGETDVLLARILVENVRAALDRVEREQNLRERTEELESRTTTLERVNRINRVIRELTQALVQASTREEIEESVCTKLANAEPYRFAWIGERSAVGEREVVPKASAGVERGYLDAVTITSDEDETGRGPTGRAVRTHEPQVQNDLRSDPPFDPWRKEALQRGYRASIAVPLRYKNTLYGVLNLYAGEPNVFDELEVSVLRELGEMIGYSINALERKKALVDDQTLELSFEVADTSITALGFANETGGRFEFDSLVERSDGSIRAFFTVLGVDPETVRRYASRATTVSEVGLIGQRDDGYRYWATLTEESFLGHLLEYGVHPSEFTASPTGGQLTVELPTSGDAQSFMNMLLDTYEGVELTSRRRLDRPVQTEEEFRALYEKQLTKRQEEVVRTAYFAGFFEWPRESTGSEVAEMLGVTQPTVNRHVRNSERKMFELLFEGVTDD